MFSAQIKRASPKTNPIAKAMKLNAEFVIPKITAVIKRPIPIERTPNPDIVQKAFLLSFETLS